MKTHSSRQFKFVIFIVALFLTALLSLSNCLIFFLPQQDVPDTLAVGKTFTIVIDAGHGGIDGGVVAKNGVKESDLNLIFTKLLQKKFEEIGATVILTRTNQNGLYGTATSGFKRRDMQKRKEIIQNSSADILVSIHMNKFSSSSRAGPQVFYQMGDTVSLELAGTVQKVLNVFTGNSHSHLSGDFYILQCLSEKPCVIIECGFLSNENELALLTDEKYQDELTDTIRDGIMLYLYKK